MSKIKVMSATDLKLIRQRMLGDFVLSDQFDIEAVKDFAWDSWCDEGYSVEQLDEVYDNLIQEGAFEALEAQIWDLIVKMS